MRTFLSLEQIGAAKPWVARVDIDAGGSVQREFLPKHKDYSSSNSAGTRGVRYCFILDENTPYEVFHKSSWNKIDRYFCSVMNGEIQRLSFEQMVEWVDRRKWLSENSKRRKGT